MVFTKDSALVKVWVSLVLSWTYTLDEVPKLFNLKEVVAEVINSMAQWRIRKLIRLQHLAEYIFYALL